MSAPCVDAAAQTFVRTNEVIGAIEGLLDGHQVPKRMAGWPFAHQPNG